MRAHSGRSALGARHTPLNARYGVLILVVLAGAYAGYAALHTPSGTSMPKAAIGSNAPSHTRAAGAASSTAPTHESPPIIIGTPRIGHTLTLQRGAWQHATRGYTYQWRACDPTGTHCTAIAGATGTRYSPTPSHLGERLEVIVTAHSGTRSASAHSARTPIIIGRRNTYVAQTAGGKASGSSCANAHPVAWLNTAANWHSVRRAVSAGTMVHLCGTISTPLTLHGSGTSSEPIMLYFEPGAQIAMPVCPGRESGCIDTNGHSYISIDGGTNGTIANTEDGTALAQQVGDSYGIEAAECNGCTIEHLTIANLYVHTSASDTAIEAGENEGINFSGSHITIAHNTLHDVGWALVSEWTPHSRDISINHNDIYRIDHGFASTAGFSGGSIGPIYVAHNHFHDYANWDTTTDAYHHDGIHCYSADARGYTPHYNGFYIYANRFGGATGKDMTAQIFIEGGTGEGTTPCADSTSSIWIFDNVGSASTALSNGIFGVYSGAPHVYNNTLIGAGDSEGACYRSLTPAVNERFANNILASCNGLMVATPGVFASLDYNLYAHGGDNAFVCGGRYLSFHEFAQWRSCMRGDRHSRRTRRTLVNSKGLKRARPRVAGAGINLTSRCTGALAALCRNIDGQPRRRSGAWSVGAY